MGQVRRPQVSPPRPLAEADKREAFDCGRECMNAWFRRHAWGNHASEASVVTVLTDFSSGAIVAYVVLSPAQIERALLPSSQQRDRPDPLPATLLGQLAVHKEYQGRGHAASLLLYALRASLKVSELIGSLGVITHPLDEGGRAFYTRFGFQDLPFDPRRAMMVRMGDLRKSGIAD